MDKRDKIAEIVIPTCSGKGCYRDCKDCPMVAKILTLFKSYKSPDEHVKRTEEWYKIGRWDGHDEQEAEYKDFIDPSALATRKVKEKCGDCVGSGFTSKSPEGYHGDRFLWTCDTCHGSKEIVVEEGAFVKCEKCEGSGENGGEKKYCQYNDNMLCAANEGGTGDCYNPNFGNKDFKGCEWFDICLDCTDGYRQITTGEQLERNDWEWRRLKDEN